MQTGGDVAGALANAVLLLAITEFSYLTIADNDEGKEIMLTATRERTRTCFRLLFDKTRRRTSEQSLTRKLAFLVGRVLRLRAIAQPPRTVISIGVRLGLVRFEAFCW